MNWDLLGNSFFIKTTASIVLVGLLLAIRMFLIRTLLHGAPKSEARRGWIVGVRNASFFTIALGLAAIWFEAVESFGTAFLALGVAAVLATRELIQCVLGGFVRTVTNPFSIGDRIEIGAHRGDVIDTHLLTTTLLEVDPSQATHLRTGRTVVIPNSRLLDATVINESHMRQYIVHFFTVVTARADWKRAEASLQEAAEIECSSFIEDARKQMRRLEREHGLAGLVLQPRVLVELSEPEKVKLLVRVPAIVGKQARLEQAIIRRYLEATMAPESAALAPGAETIRADSR